MKDDKCTIKAAAKGVVNLELTKVKILIFQVLDEIIILVFSLRSSLKPSPKTPNGFLLGLFSLLTVYGS